MSMFIVRFMKGYSAILMISALGLSCSSASAADLKPLQDGLGKGVECLFAPSAFYRPGAVFRIDNRRTRYWANVAIADQVKAVPSAAAVPVTNGSVNASAGLVASLFNLEKDGAPIAQVNASLEHRRKVHTSFDNVVWTITEDTEIDKVLDWFSGYAGKRPGNTYYVVREAYSADGGTVTFDKSLAAELGGEAAIKENLKVKPTLTFKSGRDYELKGPFPERLNVCMKAEKIVAAKAAAVGTRYGTEAVSRMPKIAADGGLDAP